MKIVKTLISTLLLVPLVSEASYRGGAKVFDLLQKEQQAAARIAEQQRAARSLSVANEASKVAYSQQQAATKVRAAFELQAQRTTYNKQQSSFLRSTAEQAKSNKERLAIQSHVQKQVNIARSNQTRAAAPVTRQFNNHANPGLVYQRRMGLNDVYIGQTKNVQRYPVRRYEHQSHLKKQMGSNYSPPSYQLVGGAPGNDATLLRVAEQAAYDAQVRYGVRSNVTNSVRPMSQSKYTSVTTGN